MHNLLNKWLFVLLLSTQLNGMEQHKLFASCKKTTIEKSKNNIYHFNQGTNDHITLLLDHFKYIQDTNKNEFICSGHTACATESPSGQFGITLQKDLVKKPLGYIINQNTQTEIGFISITSIPLVAINNQGKVAFASNANSEDTCLVEVIPYNTINKVKQPEISLGKKFFNALVSIHKTKRLEEKERRISLQKSCCALAFGNSDNNKLFIALKEKNTSYLCLWNTIKNTSPESSVALPDYIEEIKNITIDSTDSTIGLLHNGDVKHQKYISLFDVSQKIITHRITTNIQWHFSAISLSHNTLSVLCKKYLGKKHYPPINQYYYLAEFNLSKTAMNLMLKPLEDIHFNWCTKQ